MRNVKIPNNCMFWIVNVACVRIHIKTSKKKSHRMENLNRLVKSKVGSRYEAKPIFNACNITS